MPTIAEIKKALVSAGLGALSVLGTGLSAGAVSIGLVAGAALAAFVAGLAVYQVTNASP